MNETYEQLYQRIVPHYRERCRVGEHTGWVAAGDEKFATIALDAGKYLMNVPWTVIEYTGGKQTNKYEDM